jgi:hypothetical protein
LDRWEDVMTDEEIARIQARYAASTPGEWTWDGEVIAIGCIDAHTVEHCWRTDQGWMPDPQVQVDGAFLAAAHQDIPRLLAALRERRDGRE